MCIKHKQIQPDLEKHAHAHPHAHTHAVASHTHSHSHSIGHLNNTPQNKLIASLVIIAIFAIGELIGGLYSNSIALISDSIHMLSDMLAIVIALCSIYLSKKNGTIHYTYGFQKIEIIGALISIFLIIILSIFLLYFSVQRLENPPAIKGDIMIYVACVGLISNIFIMYILKSDTDNMNIKTAYIHVLGDTLQSVAVVCSGISIYCYPHKSIYIIDPILTIVFCLIILGTTFQMCKQIMYICLDRIPAHLCYDKVYNELLNIPNVKNIHDLHIWGLNKSSTCLSVHIESDYNGDEILKSAQQILKDNFDITHATIQIDIDKCNDECYKQCFKHDNTLKKRNINNEEII